MGSSFPSRKKKKKEGGGKHMKNDNKHNQLAMNLAGCNWT